MKKQKDQIPPRWAQRFLAWYCRPALLEDLQGDLNEYFDRNLKEKGSRKARLIYIIDVFKFFRSYTLRTPKFINLLIHWIMLGSYIKTSGRNIVRNKMFSTINIVGLAISMSVGLLMISFLSDLLSYDAFHEKKDRIYRAVSLNHYSDRSPRYLASTSVKVGKKIKETFSGVDEVTILRRDFAGDGRYGEKIIPISAFWASETFFSVFTFPLLRGDAATALKEPYSIVLTEKSARKLFGDEEALGKSVEFDTVDYVVTGVMKDVPTFSHLRFEALVSFSTAELQNQGDQSFLSWESIYSNYVYVLLDENVDPQILQSGLDKMSTEENAAIENRTVTVSLQPLNNIVLGRDMSNIPGPAMPSIVLWVVGGLALIVILSACFNYTNLSIARSFRRSREVGIRKTIGALKSHVMGQFISESVIIALLALVFSFLLFLLLRPQFLSIAPELRELVVLDLSVEIALYFVLLAIVVGIAAGFLPAWYFSRVNAVHVLKDASSMMVFRQVNLRKALIVIQYTFSLMFIAATIIGYKQYRNFITFDLGFKTENILNVRLEGNKADLLVKELAELPEVTEISKSLMVTSVGNYYSTQMKYNDSRDSSAIWFNSIDEMYLPLHGHKLAAGKNFSAKPGLKEESEVIVNEQVLKQLGIARIDPRQALGEEIIINERKLTIIGVLKDFHYGKVDNPIDPVIFRYLLEDPPGYVNVKVNTSDWQATLMRIDNAWRKIDRVHPLTATFYDDQIEQAYSEFSAMLKIVGLLAMLAVCIASIGLMGMVVFTTETRLKEMSIRKVLGASQRNLIYLLSKGFLILLTIAALIALPATYFFFDKIALASFPYRAPITLMELFIGVLIVMGIAFLMIGTQTLKVARSNPAEVLKNE